jgi:ABC-2 type transport system permease protein
LIYPIFWMIIFNIGCGFILSALFVIFKDIQYLYDIFTLMLMYLSAIFYYTDTYPEHVQKLFYLNPLYVYITYIREIIIDGIIPDMMTHGYCALYGILALTIGALIYKKYNYKFLYYM